MKYVTFILLIATLLGCSQHIHHKDKAIEKDVLSLERIEGTYANEGVYPNGRIGKRLSEIVFPKLKLKRHREIDQVKVVVDSNRVTCFGLKNGIEIERVEYIDGKDFNFEGNKIYVKKEATCFQCSGQGAWHLGAAIKNMSLYLTKDGDAILRNNETGVIVIVIIPIPLLVTEESDILYKRIPKTLTNSFAR